MSELPRRKIWLHRVKEMVLALDWIRPLPLVVVVDAVREEERIVTIYEPDDALWPDGYRRRR